MNRRFLVLAAVALTVIASGCTGNTESEAPAENFSSDQPEGLEVNQSDIREVTVEGGSYYFEPDTINVSVNETVRFVFENEGGFHDMRIPELEAGTERINGGETASFTVTFDEEGSYEFICSVGNHAERGMTGTIDVS